MLSACFCGSGPHVMLSAIMSSVTSFEPCSKWPGIGSSWLSSPGTPDDRHSSCTSFLHCPSSLPQQSFTPAALGPLPPLSMYVCTSSLSGFVLTYPSATRAASSVAFGPKPDMHTGGGEVGVEYSLAFSTV